MAASSISHPDRKAPAAIILAAGKGTRMKSDLPKVVHPVGGRAMVCAVVDACLEAGCERIVVVVGYKQELVRESLATYTGIEFAVQTEQLGTGHAVRASEHLFSREKLEPGHDAFVLCGDGPLIRASTLRTVLTRHRQTGASATLATSVIDDPSGYGRIVRDGSGGFVAIVEQKNATSDQLAIREVNPSYYCFDVQSLFGALARVDRNALTGEYYITDTPSLLMADGRRVEVIDAVPPSDVLSINTLEDLANVDSIFRARSGATNTSGARA
ncbi:MAG: NTP transferase domain-containing protein [Phycisphaeraceae bacterium]|nr:NTP transferase domain-containing protein [Phycisphaeraceae bacterium]